MSSSVTVNENVAIKRAADTVRFLSADAVQRANSGHPGMPMGCADFAFMLWYRYMRFDPTQPDWIGRDRFCLSAGHGSMLIYSLLHLFGFENMSIEELKNFRQWGSQTPGHPEYGHTAGVEVTAGPLGTGFATAVGMAMANKQFAARMGNCEIFDSRYFTISGDGCMMEGVTSEAASLAGHNQLDNLVCFYDDNAITIEGSTDLAFSTEEVCKRFEAYGWHVIKVDGHDLDEIDEALNAAVTHKGQPVLIAGRTTIGCGAPSIGGSQKAHGAPLGEDEIRAGKEAVGFPGDQTFYVPSDVYDLCTARLVELKEDAKAWRKAFDEFMEANPDKAQLYKELSEPTIPKDLGEQLREIVVGKNTASRKSGGAVMQKIGELIPAFTGGSADLAPSTNTLLEKEGHFSPEDYSGRNFHFGVREFAMTLCGSGMALHKTAIPYVATFAVFCDFMKPGIRLAALQKLNVKYVLTHDSIFVGEDGPTHQPIEQLAMLRGIPGLTVFRPCASIEVADAWAESMKCNGPCALFMTRQNLEPIPEELRDNVNVAKGAYILSDDPDYQITLIATGSEVMPAYHAAEMLRKQGHRIRVVSMPSWEIFEAQDRAYKESIINPGCERRVAIEAGTTFGWDRYVGWRGLKIGMDTFGASAPKEVLADKFGFTPERIVEQVKAFFTL